MLTLKAITSKKHNIAASLKASYGHKKERHHHLGPRPDKFFFSLPNNKKSRFPQIWIFSSPGIKLNSQQDSSNHKDGIIQFVLNQISDIKQQPGLGQQQRLPEFLVKNNFNKTPMKTKYQRNNKSLYIWQYPVSGRHVKASSGKYSSITHKPTGTSSLGSGLKPKGSYANRYSSYICLWILHNNHCRCCREHPMSKS